MLLECGHGKVLGMTHQQIDERSQAFGQIIAERLRDEPALIERARQNAKRWMLNCSPTVAAALVEWELALDGPREELLRILTSADERSTRLRQSNPFAGVLTSKERNAVIRRFYSHDPSAT